MNAKVIAVTIQKGGVGKTTTFANLGIRFLPQIFAIWYELPRTDKGVVED